MRAFNFAAGLLELLLVCAACSERAAAATALAPPSEVDTQTASSEPILAVRTVDAGGEPVSGVQAFLISVESSLPLCEKWVSAAEGQTVQIRRSHLSKRFVNEGEELTGSISLVIRAPGYSWVERRLEFPLQQETVDVTLPRGRSLELALHDAAGRPVPLDLSPIIFAPGQSAAAWLTGVQLALNSADDAATFSASQARSLGDGRFELQVPPDCPPLYVLINHPGFLRCLQAGPFGEEAVSAGRIAIALPAPGGIAASVRPNLQSTHAYSECGVSLSFSPEIPDGGWSFSLPATYFQGDAADVTFDDLAPGAYGVEAFTGNKENRHDRSRPDFCSKRSGVNVLGGAPQSVALTLETFDEPALRDSLRGDYTAIINVRKGAGPAPAGLPFNVSFSLHQFSRKLSVLSGELPADGRIVVKDLPDAYAAPLEVTLGGNFLGSVYLERGESEQTFEFAIAPAAGEPAPNITLTRLDNGEKFDLQSLQGQIVLLDFWASWCGPCQAPMASNNEIAGRRASDWRGKAVIIGASIDEQIDVIQQHVEKRNWNDVIQAFCGEGAPGWESDAAKAYAIKGVPSAFLIDQRGVIAWAGHPASHDLEKAIDELLSGGAH